MIPSSFTSSMPPRPSAIRLWTRARRVGSLLPPFGLAAWSDDAQAIAVLLEGSAALLDDSAAVAAQIPDAASLPPATPVVVLGTSAPGADPWRRLWLRPSSVKIARAPRCSALLARGYVNLGTSIDPRTSVDLAWGFTPAVS